MPIILEVLIGWAGSAVLAIICWTLYMLVWVWPRRHGYPTIEACRADFHRDALYRVMSRWLYIEVYPVLVALHYWRRYNAFLAHQRSIEQLKRMGWHVKTLEHADGVLEIQCEIHGPVSQEMLEQTQAVVEDGLRKL